MEQNQETNLFGLTIDTLSKEHLAEAARWGKFLAIIGFVMCGLMIVGGFFMGVFMSTLPGGYRNDGFGGAAIFPELGILIPFIYIGFALLYFFPCLFLFKFSINIKAALHSQEQQTLNTSFQNLKKMFRFVGIVTIVLIALYLVLILFAVVTAASTGF